MSKYILVVDLPPEEFESVQEEERSEKVELHIYTKDEVRKARHETLRLLEWAFEQRLEVKFDDAGEGDCETVTYCTLTDQSCFGARSFAGWATRAPSDKHNKWIGRMYALQRAVDRLQSQAEQFTKGGMRK